MKFLIIWEEHFHYIHSIAHALEINGHEASVFTFRRFDSKKDASLVDRIKYKLGLGSKEHYKRLYYKKKQDRLIEQIINDCPDVVIVLNGNYRYVIDETFFSVLKSKNMVKVLWFLDGIEESTDKTDTDRVIDKHYLDKFDKVYVFENRDVDKLKQKYNINAKQLYIGAADEIYNCRENDAQKQYDLCFVGGAEPKRLEVLNKVVKYCQENDKKIIIKGLFAYSNKIKSFREKSMQRRYTYLKHYMTMGKVQPEALASLYKITKINLNIVTARHDSVNPRTFEIMATNSFQLVDYNKEYELIFKNKENIAMYKNTDELLELIDFYLNNERERIRIAENGYKLVQDKYLFKDIVKTILKDLNQSEDV